ncbi:RGS-domain-containing protein, partial [Aureobasidium melanogenum]
MICDILVVLESRATPAGSLTTTASPLMEPLGLLTQPAILIPFSVTPQVNNKLMYHELLGDITSLLPVYNHAAIHQPVEGRLASEHVGSILLKLLARSHHVHPNQTSCIIMNRLGIGCGSALEVRAFLSTEPSENNLNGAAINVDVIVLRDTFEDNELHGVTRRVQQLVNMALVDAVALTEASENAHTLRENLLQTVRAISLAMEKVVVVVVVTILEGSFGSGMRLDWENLSDPRRDPSDPTEDQGRSSSTKEEE